MTLEMFDRIVEKIRHESPVPNPQINLYNWGEPLLHPQLPTMIVNIAPGQNAIVPVEQSQHQTRAGGGDRRRSRRAENLALRIFAADLFARPCAGGNLELVPANMRLVREYAGHDYGAATKFWVGHHILPQQPAGHGTEVLAVYARSLVLPHHPIAAFYMPLERVVDVIDACKHKILVMVAFWKTFCTGLAGTAKMPSRDSAATASIASCVSIRPSSITTAALPGVLHGGL